MRFPLSFDDTPCVGASTVFKRRGRWYAGLACPGCSSHLQVKLSLRPMVAHCIGCAVDVEADVTQVMHTGRA